MRSSAGDVNIVLVRPDSTTRPASRNTVRVLAASRLGETVGDHHDRKMQRVGEGADGRHDVIGDVGIEGGGRLVEEKRVWIAHEGARDADALPLSTRKRLRIACRERAVHAGEMERVVGRHGARRRDVASCRRLRERVRDVEIVGDRTREHHWRLEHKAHATAKRAHRDRCDRRAVIGDLSTGRIIQAIQQSNQRRLARAGGSHEGHDFAGGNVEVDAAERVGSSANLLHPLE